jgi:hypothetical protein
MFQKGLYHVEENAEEEDEETKTFIKNDAQNFDGVISPRNP